ncbi:metal ABC transporter substrate-binding protein [Spirochaeta isovalerica]|uniref:ABC-type Zn uptake system ZnuABC Zn-binding protein ZnuA n=1 Tax=Spirochaeta isovalerica TaxID=150 RepID=A0A841R835_9SPIO|nr:metal ABC transporter substrate-binding protein [Spirochaeta isovalerica]MBB6480035.1 ABC-type Zn uptake system ZnuABC Zn-binding protein ZnuA [Spirochaeta isovalerica]
MSRIKKSATTALFLLAFISAGLTASGASENNDGLTVITTTSIITDVVKNIAGDHITVKGLIPQGGNPHNYQPTPREMAMVEKADLLLVSGLGLEEALLDSLKNVSKGKVVEVSSRIEPLAFEEEGEHHDLEDHDDEADHDEGDDHHHDQDPHTWTSLLNVLTWTEVISDALSELDPANRTAYQANAENYRKKLLDLDSRAREILSAIDEKDRKLVSDHSLFGYFARDYGFEDFGALVPSFSTNGEVSAKDFSRLIEEVNEYQIKAVFIGNTAGDSIKKLGAVLVEESDHPVELLTIMTGSLAAPGETGDTYLGYFEYNVNQIAKGLRSEN